MHRLLASLHWATMFSKQQGVSSTMQEKDEDVLPSIIHSGGHRHNSHMDLHPAGGDILGVDRFRPLLLSPSG